MSFTYGTYGNREVIYKAIDEMLDTSVIKSSRSPCSFPVVIEDKKDGSKIFCIYLRRYHPLSDYIIASLCKC